MEDSSPPAIAVAEHLLKEIQNPFPGLLALEAKIGRRIVDRIGSNEGLPCEEHPLRGLIADELFDAIRLYPDPYCRSLRSKLAALNTVPVEEVLVDAGADNLILLSLRSRILPGDVVVTTAGTYPTFKYFAEGVGAHVVEVPYKVSGTSLAVDLDGLGEAARSNKAALVYLANPDNPTGSVHPAESISNLRRSIPESTSLIVDEAYIDFSPAHALHLCPRSSLWQNTVQLRTLSKSYALAGLRVGYAIADARWVAKADQIRPQYSINHLSSLLALRVLDAEGFSAGLLRDTVSLRGRLAGALAARGAAVLPSATNFVAIACASPEEAARRQKALWEHGAAVHRPPHPAASHLLRVTAHPAALQEHVLEALAGPLDGQA